ncbi:MAG: hypothetical protein N2C12_13505 [Planctomycetales bacterium]
MMENHVREERTGWRDEQISRRHRRWGYDCPAIDIDFLLMEYDRAKPSALVEYKHEKAQELQISHPSVKALVNLANDADIPAVLCRYADDFSWWYPSPLNEKARQYIGEPKRLSESEWVAMLYHMRGRPLPKELEDQLV